MSCRRKDRLLTPDFEVDSYIIYIYNTHLDRFHKNCATNALVISGGVRGGRTSNEVSRRADRQKLLFSYI